MKIGVPKEILAGETRVALIPAMVSALTRFKHEVLIEHGAGARASFSDDQYVKAGATIIEKAARLYQEADLVLKVQPPDKLQATGEHEATLLREGGSYLGFLSPLTNTQTVKIFTERKICAFAMEYVPRITRAQSMDALSSMASLAGYKAVMLAANRLGKIFPLMMTAAGTIPPATVLILGAGVAGLQAIATAKRLGAKVEAFDPRPAVKEQVKSLGAAFIEMEMPKDAETLGGYAKELSPEFIKKEMEAIGGRLPKVNVVISTAQVFGKRAPILLTEEMVKMLPAGSIIVDLAAEQGGNCALTKAGETVEQFGVTIMGPVNIPAMLPVDASQMYSKNVTNLFQHIFGKGEADFSDEIVKGACITRDGAIVNEMVRSALQSGVK